MVRKPRTVLNGLKGTIKNLEIPASLIRDTDKTLSPKGRTNKVQSFYGDGKDVIVIFNHLNVRGCKSRF